MAHLQEKGTFWGKVRSSTNKISSSLANLSIRSEHDGDSVNSTLIHTALVNHYIKKNEQFPSWLGEEQHEPQQQQQPQQSQQSSAQEQIRQPVYTQRFQPQQSHQQQAGTSRFASRFQQQQQQQQQQRQTNQSPQLSSRFGSSVDSSSAGSRFSGNSGNGHGLPGGGPQRTDSSSGNAMKDRLKRNNYRSNFNV
ncbi:hypothetical protein BN7_4537 [Wickerhamomyces ciferrii]|uniref:Mso1 N-terminal domain-containing protein n=1 Tax=Wickerhamomyces ciferrii (strain ATCC 14091 / BCRC 22168 / CBS 111 / JCM 3599 / NBRC 0793 / NRRL Y-1031 F-60-10) TaxID=1206466 RepID=K0KIC2_WICCF|nr:uncharacterized protein BN7_4537 [Wickerhamomyces ciferrii]CCH44960.1 hypothetical protein BN7_4537 [Wickerhamomyces ciferrii]